MTPTELRSTVIRQKGTISQRERFAADLLPEDELLRLVRAELFRPFDGFPRWKMVQREEISHDVLRQCFRNSLPDIRYFSGDEEGLRGDQWDAFRSIKDAAGVASQHEWLAGSAERAREMFGVKPRKHWAQCEVCRKVALRHSALVSVTWPAIRVAKGFAPRVLSREYALP